MFYNINTSSVEDLTGRGQINLTCFHAPYTYVFLKAVMLDSHSICYCPLLSHQVLKTFNQEK